MENRPDFLLLLAGLFKAGLCVALINTNQRGQALAHSIEVAGAKHVIVGQELASALRAAESFFTVPAAPLGPGRRAGRDERSRSGAGGASRHAGGRCAEAQGCTAKDRAFFIYTSGTTGLPKAANFSHMRMLFMMSGFVGALNPKAERPHL